jgi:RNA polymerase sigma factor (sigma-70 family)
VAAAALAGLSDAELVRRFAAGPGPAAEAAFTVLLCRHGPLVYRVCRAAVRQGHDADDAFQATFLVLARKAASLPPHNDLGPWLYEVARRVSAHARAEAVRRRRLERQVAAEKAPPGGTDEADLAAAVHDALGRLPERFRAPVVLCDLEGLSYQEAAGRLGWSHGSVRNRLARGRQRLRVALERMGVAPAAAALASGAAPVVPRALAEATARAAVLVAARSAGGAVPESVLALMNWGLQSMLLTKLKTAGMSLLAAAALVAGAYGLSAQPPADNPEPAAAKAIAKAEPAAAKAVAKAEPKPPAVPPRARPETMVAKLSEVVNIDQTFDNIPLREVLYYLGDRFDVTFIVDVQSFDRDTGNLKVEEHLVRLPKMPGVSLSTILRYVLTQVQGTLLVRNDHLAVVTLNQAVNEVYGERPQVEIGPHRLLQPLVNVVYDRRPLERVLADIAEQSGRNVVLDPRVTDREKLTVTAKLLNAPTDTAVRVVADLVNLKAVQVDNVFFVTTREHAAELAAEEAQRAEARRREWLQPPRPQEPARPATPPAPKQ